jgi:DGQHR domain-containing protein
MSANITLKSGLPVIEVTVVKQPNIDTVCYRGSAALHDLAVISQADVFDQVTNPNGLQRDLSPKHASEAYNYAAREPDKEFPRAFPEVILNVRNEDVLSVEKINVGRQRQIEGFKFTFDLVAIQNKMANTGEIVVSRVDGNHRLFYAAGDGRREPLWTVVPFQIHVGLSPEQEANLFVDVNANQKGLNSSHLHVLRSRLTSEEQELRDHPERVIARKLASDPLSPWYNLVYLGGSRKGSREAEIDRPISFVTLESGVKRTLTKSQYIHDLTNPEAQYMLIRNYWEAVKRTFDQEWQDPKEYLLLKNLGVLVFSIVGGTVIDRSMARGEVTPEAMMYYIMQVHEHFDWSREAIGERSVVGMSGNRAALLLAGELTANMLDPDADSESVASLQAKLLEAAPDVKDFDAEEWREAPNVHDLEEAGVQRSVS